MKRNPRKQSCPFPVISRAVRNSNPEKFRDALIAIPDGNFEVERIADGRSICIIKPGGKVEEGFDYDFEVLLCDAARKEAWRISHKAIYNDIKKKVKVNSTDGNKIIMMLEKVFNGEEPDAVIAGGPTLEQELPGLPVEAILKLYKWIWGQEDCNYPPPRKEGRSMSMRPILEL